MTKRTIANIKKKKTFRHFLFLLFLIPENFLYIVKNTNVASVLGRGIYYIVASAKKYTRKLRKIFNMDQKDKKEGIESVGKVISGISAARKHIKF